MLNILPLTGLVQDAQAWKIRIRTIWTSLSADNLPVCSDEGGEDDFSMTSF